MNWGSPQPLETEVNLVTPSNLSEKDLLRTELLEVASE